MKTLTACIALLLLSIPCLGQQYDKVADRYGTSTEWFTDAGYGMFIHFGLYSQLAGEWEGETVEGYAEWIQAKADIPPETYARLAASFNPASFDAEKIVQLAKASGMKYLVVTAKHHEGFALWDSQYTDFDIAATPYGKDIIGALSRACENQGLAFGIYYSIIDWHHDSQQINAEADGYWNRWAQLRMKEGAFDDYLQFMQNQLQELVQRYDPAILWFDGDWVDWWSMEHGIDLYRYVKEMNPAILVNNRVAKRAQFNHDFGTPEQEHLGEGEEYIWEACYTLNDSWGYKATDRNWKSADTVFGKLKEINANGGNLLLNVGLKGDGSVPEASSRILLKVGDMLETHWIMQHL